MFGISRSIDSLDVQKCCLQAGIHGFKAKSELCLIDRGLALFALCQNQLQNTKNRKKLVSLC